ncbi:hypothetical protein B0T16DRAFT_507526 [Cercophora newfieldiana]|uniref:Uncharacterized protein n=1 Tax=Cercophora newfieldiana TaxID=92897 RepID=A0AA40CTS9_9PEZI|nr:hypothetical protein B0T16DRAFT_507526 [Cercophora newfieldiana]
MAVMAVMVVVVMVLMVLMAVTSSGDVDEFCPGRANQPEHGAKTMCYSYPTYWSCRWVENCEGWTKNGEENISPKQIERPCKTGLKRCDWRKEMQDRYLTVACPYCHRKRGKEYLPKFLDDWKRRAEELKKEENGIAWAGWAMQASVVNAAVRSWQEKWDELAMEGGPGYRGEDIYKGYYSRLWNRKHSEEPHLHRDEETDTAAEMCEIEWRQNVGVEFKKWLKATPNELLGI